MLIFGRKPYILCLSGKTDKARLKTKSGGYATYTYPWAQTVCQSICSVGGGFYGIWVYASKDRREAEEFVAQMSESLDGKIFITTDWENLNDEMYYVVSAGQYDSKDDAKLKLDEIKKIYSNAYIKYSGNRKTDDKN